ncbi:putative exostosin [Helianthus annuus]|nr:putative exostosin [Helianthus annuus]
MKKYKHPIQFQIVHQRRWVLMVGLVATIHLFCQTLMLPYGTAVLSLLPGHNNPSYFTEMSNSDTLEDEFQQESLQLVKSRDFDHVFIEEMISVDLSNNLGDGVSINSNISIDPKILMVVNKSGNGSQGQVLPINEKYALFQTDDVKRMRCLMPPKSVMYIDQMERLLARNRRASRAMRPRWSSPRDQEILAAKMQITKTPSRITDQELYAPVFRNVTMFKRLILISLSV